MIGIKTNIEVEAVVILKPLTYCGEKGLTKIQIQTDSLAIRNMLYKEWKMLWELVEIVESI